MKDWQSQTHVKWECKYHVVIVPKYREKKHFKKYREAIGKVIRELCRQKDVGLLEGNAASDHLHMLLSVPPKYSIAMTIGILREKVRSGFIVNFFEQRVRFLGVVFGLVAIV